ncbi:MAG: cell division protein FtsK [Kutzneria sp.]|nr:cell division protein FtsK [Kutzneria sp.]
MNKRTDRRQRISEAFDVFRRTVAAALGAAARAHHEARVLHARDLFEIVLREDGIDKALADPRYARVLRNPTFTDVVDRAIEDRERVFAKWTAEGPRRLTELVTAAAPGAASEPYANWLGEVGTVGSGGPVPELWRIGTAVATSAPLPQEFPVAVPLLDRSHLAIGSTPASRAVAESLVEALVLRVLSYFQPGLVHVHVWDVSQLTGSLPGLYPLTRAGLLTVHDPARPVELLDQLTEHIRKVHTSVLSSGHMSLRSQVGEAGERTEPWRIAVFFGNGTTLPDDELHKLQRVARNGLACGVQLIMVDCPISVNSPVETVLLNDDLAGTTTMSGRKARFHVDPALPRELVPRASAMIADALEERRSRACVFDELLPERLWSSTSSTGVQTPVGHRDGVPVVVSIGDTSPHVLIGGPSGSGKTNFLYAMLGGLAARYSPDELELYLLDFKEGVSFAQFAPGRKDPTWLPNARLVGVNVNQDREFGVALLRFLAEQMRRRADAAKRHEVTKLEELRADDPQGRWPRIVAVIDEFQYLFADKDAVTREAVSLLEDLARRGRSQGIHLVLSSQDVSSIEAFWGKPAIFEQFTVRVALPKARRVLVDGNTEAIELPRWHAVINHESGVSQGNEVARIPDATARGTMDRLQASLFQLRPPGLAQPRLFDGSRIPVLEELPGFHALGPAGGRAPTVLLGKVIDVEDHAARVSLARAPGRNLAVFGSAHEESTSVLRAAALSLARQHLPGEAVFTVAPLIDDARPFADDVTRALTAVGHEVAVVDLDGIREHLSGIAAELTARLTATVTEPPKPHYLLVYAMDAANALLEAKDRATSLSGVDSLRQVIKHGPENRTHLIGWWRSAQRLKSVLMMGASADDIGSWVAFDVQGQDLTGFASGQLITWSPRPRRGLFFDRFEHSRPEVVIPFDATERTGE